MINQAAIKRYLSRELNEYDWLKTHGDRMLEAALDTFDPLPNLGKVKLWRHQRACFMLLNDLKRFMLHIDMGGGKTLLTLLLLSYRKQCGEPMRALVFVPYITSVDTWIEETAKHTPHLKCVPLIGSTAENLKGLQGDGDLFVICYASAVAMVSEPKKVTKGKGKSQLNYPLLGTFNFNMLVLDEVHKTKNVSTLTYRMCRNLAARAKWVFGLTGTPFGRDLQDLWAQFHLIDFGETLGPTLGFYREVFFKQSINYWGGYEYTFNKKMMPDLKRIIKNKSIRYAIDDFADMPPREFITKSLPAPHDSAGYCQAAIAKIKEAAKGGSKDNYHVIESSYLQLRQLSSGFMTLKGEDNDRVQISFEENPKLDLLMELIEAMPYGCKMVVFHHFIHTSNMIGERLRQAKIGHARIWSGQKDPIGELRRFKEDDRCTVLVINWRSGSSSLNLQGANYMVVYEQPDSPIDRKQGEARVWRPGQSKRVFVYDLIVHGTVDMQMMKANQAGSNLLKELLEGKVGLL